MHCYENTGKSTRPMWIEKNKLEKDVMDEIKGIGRGQIMQSFLAMTRTLDCVLILEGRHYGIRKAEVI